MGGPQRYGMVAMSREYEEKRTFMRMTVECPVTFEVVGSGEPLQGTARDLSAIGMLIDSSQSVEVGAQVEMTMAPKNSLVPPLRARGTVLRVTPNGERSYEIGVEIKEHL